MPTTKQTQIGFIGTYTRKEGHVDGKAAGFFSVAITPDGGALKILNTFSGLVNPSYLCLSQKMENLYVVEEDNPGRVIAYGRDQSGDLLRLSSHDTGSPASCHVSNSHNDRFVAVSNYVGGLLNVYTKDAYGGLVPSQRIDLQAQAPTGRDAHAHAAFFSKNDKFLYCCDLGTDRIYIFEFNKKQNQYQAAEMPFLEVRSGSGPRHFCLHPKEKSAYALTEYSNEVVRFEREKRSGALIVRQYISTLPVDFDQPSFGADIRIHPSGDWLFASNRGHDSIAIFSVGPNGELSNAGHCPTGGIFPRAFNLTKKGDYLYVANQNSDKVVQFAFDTNRGTLTQVNELEVPTPVCIAFD